jgi:hypothetical protein
MGMILYTYKSCGCGGGAYYSDSSQDEEKDGGGGGDRECGKKK